MAQFDYQAFIAQLSADGFNSGEFVRQLVERGYQELIDAGAHAHIGAARHERTQTRRNQRNGSRRRILSTTAGDITIALPKLRSGSYYPEFMEKRRRIDKALYAVVMTAYIEGVSTRRVDELVKSLGAGSGISRSEVSRICKGIDAMVEAFRERDLSGQAYPYLYIDATYVKARTGHRVRSRAVAIAMAVSGDGRRELLGLDIGRGEDQVFWEEFLRSLKGRGLRGVKLVISDAHVAIATAVERILPDASWQACRIHFGRNIASRVRPLQRQLALAALSAIFIQPDRERAVAAYHSFAEAMERLDPRLADYADDRELELTAFSNFPPAHWRKIWSTNPLERLMAEIKRRTRVVQLFPDDESVIRLVGAVLCEQNDEWLASERRYMSRESMGRIGRVEPTSAPDRALAPVPNF